MTRLSCTRIFIPHLLNHRKRHFHTWFQSKLVSIIVTGSHIQAITCMIQCIDNLTDGWSNGGRISLMSSVVINGFLLLVLSDWKMTNWITLWLVFGKLGGTLLIIVGYLQVAASIWWRKDQSHQWVLVGVVLYGSVKNQYGGPRFQNLLWIQKCTSGRPTASWRALLWAIYRKQHRSNGGRIGLMSSVVINGFLLVLLYGHFWFLWAIYS